ncbi:MAG TPA: AAA family ATPase [Candidatus Saccharimonadales bacterium]|nr:AAA family ATPase [Candidatus Saccharimonadales bacterium]
MRSLVIGKFYPPHLGHSYLIDYALSRSDEVVVLVCDSPAYTIPAAKRQQWLQAIHPTANVQIIPDLDDDDNSKAWAKHTLAFLGYTPDVVFSSENYGTAYAKYMKTTHHMVDHNRVHIPISATRIRANLFDEWRYLHPVVKTDLALRIVIVGAESTGTTTLARDLAAHLDTPWVPEYGRLYSDGFLAVSHQWTSQDFVHIASTQQAIEKQIAHRSNGIIVCDTNASATEIWQKRYMDTATPDVRAIGANDKIDLYIITGDEIPFVQDGTRDGKHIRHDMHQSFIQHIKKTNIPYIIALGTEKARLKQSLQAVQTFIHYPVS